MTGFVDRGGKISDAYDHPFDGDRWYVATKPFEMIPLFGASRIHLIIPSGIDVTVTDAFTHCEIFWMDGFKTNERGVSIYADTKLIG